MEKLRNVAIIAHVDHGKTTLVDEMLKQSGVYRENQEVVDRVMDSNDLERERGITILAKNTAVRYGDTKINIVDTPGHADFGGEVERILKMVNGVILLVDAAEGPMPQTRFVLSRALELGHRVIVVINKIDRPDQRIHEVIDEVLELLMDLNATDEQLDSPMLFCSGRQGTASYSPDVPGKDLRPLFDAILKYIPAPEGDPDGPAQVLISTIDYSEYVGRIGVGRITRGVFKAGMNVVHTNVQTGVTSQPWRLGNLYQYDGLKRVDAEEVRMGDIVALSGAADLSIGDTVCAPECIEGLPFVKISEPTVTMTFQVNDSPFAGREGTYVTSRHLRARLMRELQTDVSLRVSDTDSTDAFEVCGRGELHLSILIENMRRQGYEFAVSKPRVIYREIDGVKCEPIEELTISVPEEFASKMIDMVTRRKGEMSSMETQGDRVNIEFNIPSRGIIGLRTNVLTASQGEAIMAHRFKEYQPYKGEIPRRTNGSMIAMESGTAFAYAIDKLQDRGKFFIYPQDEVYAGQVVGEHVHENDLVINVNKSKKLTNMRASGSDDKARIIPPVIFSLEEALEYIKEDEYVEVTPKSMRMRKVILDETERKRANKN